MTSQEVCRPEEAWDLARELGLQQTVTRDTEQNFDWVPRVAVRQDLFKEAGARYHFSQIDYCVGEQVQASRMIAEIAPGDRTELAYWSAQAPSKHLTISQGKGWLTLASPRDAISFEIQNIGYDGAKLPLLPADRFYTLEADEKTDEPLVVSGFYHPAVASWEAFETAFTLKDKSITTPQGVIEIPSAFRHRYLRQAIQKISRSLLQEER